MSDEHYLVPDFSTLPRYLFDPAWDDPRVAANHAFEVYRQARFSGAAFGDGALSPAATLPTWERRYVDARRFALGPEHVFSQWRGLHFRGGAFNELYRRYSFGNQRPTANFHAQEVSFGADEEGGWFLQAKVGRFGGEDGNEAGLAVVFHTATGPLGGAAWSGSMDPPDDRVVRRAGRDRALAAAYRDLVAVEVRFYGRHQPQAATRDDDGETPFALGDLFGDGS